MQRERIETALEGLRQGLKNDGADLVIGEIGNDRVEVKLALGENACHECIVEPNILKTVVEAALRDILPASTRVFVCDPRENNSPAE